MCAIIDANVAYQVFSEDRPPAGKRFFDWLSSPRGELVVGGKLRAELTRDVRFQRWLTSAIRYGRARSVVDDEVEERAQELHRTRACKSDDEHVLALALVSGARLLHQRHGTDRGLQEPGDRGEATWQDLHDCQGFPSNGHPSATPGGSRSLSEATRLTRPCLRRIRTHAPTSNGLASLSRMAWWSRLRPWSRRERS